MRKILLTLSALTLMTSVAMAAPVTDLQKGQSVAGYSYWNTKINVDNYDFGKINTNGFYAETAIDEKLIVGIETMKGSKSTTISGVAVSADTRFTDVSLKYKLNKNVQLIAGNRSYDTNVSIAGTSASDTTSKFFYGVGTTTDINKNTTAYASIIHSDIADDWQIGVNHNLSKNVGLNVNYRSYSEDGFSLKGLGAGIAYKF